MSQLLSLGKLGVLYHSVTHRLLHLAATNRIQSHPDIAAFDRCRTAFFLSSNNEKIFGVQTEFITNMLVNAEGPILLATAIRALRNLEDSNPSLINNLVTVGEHPLFGRMYQVGHDYVHAGDWMKASNHLKRSVHLCLLKVAGLPVTAVPLAGGPAVVDLPRSLHVLSIAPSLDEYRITAGDSGSGPRFDRRPGDCVTELDGLLQASFTADSILFAKNAERFRDLLICWIALIGTDSPRTMDLVRTKRASDSSPFGNLTAHRTLTGEIALLATVVSNKTGLPGMNLIPPFVARYLLVLLDLITPKLVEGVRDDAVDCIPEAVRSETDFDFTPMMGDIVKSVLLTELGYRAEVSSHFKKEMQFISNLHQREGFEFNLAKKELSTKYEPETGGIKEWSYRFDESIVLRLSDVQARAVIKQDVIVEALDVSDMTIGQLRTLLVNIKTGILEILPLRVAAGPGSPLNSIMATQAKIADELSHISPLARPGGSHSAQTHMINYLSAKSVAIGDGTAMRIPMVALQGMELISSSMTMITGFPQAPFEGTSDVVLAHNIRLHNPWMPIKDLLQGPKDPESIKLRLLEELRRVCNDTNADFRPGQFHAMVELISSNLPTIVNSHCGSGKTLTAFLPLLLAPKVSTLTHRYPAKL